MIPNILIIAGILLSVIGIIGIISLILLPLKKLGKVVYEWEDDVLKYEESAAGRWSYRQSLKRLRRIYLCLLVVGVCSFFLGFYLGYAEKGESFWLYSQVLGKDDKSDHWDKITEDNKYIAEDGDTYTFYVLVSGDKYYFCGDECDGIKELTDRLSDIRRENTVILVDSFAVSASYHDAENALKKLGIKYETEEN